MESTTSGAAGADRQEVQRIRALAADMVVELQRADGKATALCGAAGGLLTVGVAMLSGLGAAPWALVAALLSASMLLVVAVGAALWALRPVLPQTGSPGALFGVPRRGDIRPLVASLAEMSDADQLRLEEERLAVLAVLARRKFRAVRAAVDLVVAALTMAGIGLLIPYMAT
ncbi:Pycsar system effector family protein [Streptomyces phaeochromogenes]